MKATDSKIRSFIGNSERVFLIPPFQRNYTWSNEQCEELFDDIITSIKKQKTHYIGNIVYFVGKDSSASFLQYILVDGQQRITSILLLLSAIRNYLPSDDYDRMAIDKKYLTNEFGTEKFKVKLKQTESDEVVFDKILLNKQLTEEEKNSNLYKNFEYFNSRLRDLPNEDIDIKDFYNAVGDLDIVDLDLKIEDDLESVQKIFEKINSTGKPLSPADLIRNYLLIANTIEKQQQLYDDYWVKIEELYDNKNNISDFAKHYLITKRGDWVEENKMYSTFRSYFSNVGEEKETILSEMLRLSKYYNWFKNANTDNLSLNVMIKELNILKSDDMYSLLLILFDRLYENNNSELLKIINLLVDFMIRYRIVGLSNGSADLRSTLFNVLTKITSGEIEPTYDSIKYELSNSPSPNGRFPNDEEFKMALQSKVNISYAKALLYKMEYTETRNIFVDISQITIEHVLPQSLSKEWIEYLGGEEEASKIHNTYLNCIGNLAMLSGSYNSSNSNKPWDFKKNTLSQAQFIFTQKIASNDEWKEIEIKNRNTELSDLAVKYITSPLPREKDYKTIETMDEFTPGLYDIFNDSVNVTGTNINSLVINKEVYPINGWFELVYQLCNVLYDRNKEEFDDIVKNNKVHKSSSARLYPLGKDPIFSNDKKYLVSPAYVENGKFYVEQCLSADRARNYARDVIKFLNIQDEIKIDLQ
jgi:uncharacterized protein with ParB-like and HNH nuclease domain